MTSLKFNRPTGSCADIAELSYVSALHQTSPDLRPDGSIDQTDIALFLRSKYGIDMTEEDVRDVILRGLSTGSLLLFDHDDIHDNNNSNSNSSATDISGTTHNTDTNNNIHALKSRRSKNNNESILDLAEVVAALIIPDLIKAAAVTTSNTHASNNCGENETAVEAILVEDEDNNNSPPRDMLSIVLESILKTTFGYNSNNTNQEFVINRDTVKEILLAFGEDGLAKNDRLIRDMVQQANIIAVGKSVSSSNDDDDDDDDYDPELGPETLNCESFARALTSDVTAYQIEDDAKPTTTYADVFGVEKPNPVAFCCKGLLWGKVVVEPPPLHIISDPVKEESQNADEKDETFKDEIFDQEEEKDDNNGPADNNTTAVDDQAEPRKKNDAAQACDYYQVKHIFTAPSIDYLVDAQASRCIAVTLWVFFLLHVLAAGTFSLQDFPSLVPSDLAMCPSDTDTPHVGCDTLEAFLAWVDRIVTITVIGGIVIMGLGSLGNRVGTTSHIAVLSSIIPALYFFIKPFTSIGTSPGDLKGAPHQQFALALSMFVVLVIIAERLRQFICLFGASNEWLGSGSRMAKFVSRGLTGTEYERLEAASYKINRMLRNACDITRESMNEELDYYYDSDIILLIIAMTEHFIESYDGNTIIIFARSAQSAATILIDRRQDLKGSALKRVEATFTAVLPALETLRLDSCDALASSKDANITFDMTDICSANSTYISDLTALVLASMSQRLDPIKEFLKSNVDAGADTLANVAVVIDPIEPWMIQMAFGIGGLVAFAGSIFLAALYMPSVASTTLKYRCGVLPSMTDPERFSDLYRDKMHEITLLTGALFWGALVYVAGLAFVIAIIILILCWFFAILPAMVEEFGAPGILGKIIGSVLAFILQWALFSLCACATYTSFYRRRPGWANMHSLLWEAAWIALSIFFIAMRALKLIIVAALQIGRIDIPFLAEGVGEYGGVHLDKLPNIFRKDVLAHEAHNHPFIERLSKIYLMKICHGNDFANSAGTCWRLIFVLSLFPWLRQYRVDARYGLERKSNTSRMLPSNEMQ
eukprot:scaffold52562_cov54-Attheya_sp.AAC.1